MKHPSSRVLAALAGVALLVSTAACGDDDDDDAAATTAAAAAPATTAAAAPATTAGADTTAAADDGLYGSATTGGDDAAAAGGTIAIADSSLGEILVDGEGMTLYMFVPDNQGPSVCLDECLGAWPALYAPVTAGDGVDASLIGTAVRTDDGKEQATYGGWPLYTFAQDAAAGDVTGQDANQKWYVIGADGEPIKTVP